MPPETQKIYDKLLKFATLRPRSEKEIKDWFVRKKIQKSLQNNLFNRLERLDLVDDRKFSEWWVDQRVTFKPMGVKRLKFELRQKGVNEGIISDVLSNFEESFDQKKLAVKILDKKFEQLARLPKEKALKKAFSYLTQRGFDYEIIYSVIDELGLKGYNLRNPVKKGY